jgi:hypothetical protein
LADCFETSARGLALAIVSSQITKRLFALKDRRRSNLFLLPAVRGYVGPIPALWQTHFHCARGKSMRLRPQERESLQAGMLRGFTIGVCYSRSHFASSRAQ